MVHSAPTNIGGYEITREVARGSTGIVYSGYDPKGQRAVAVKVADTSTLASEGLREKYQKMFKNEAETASKLDHPNILKVYDAGADGAYIYIVTELIEDGKTLKPHCRSENLLAIHDAVEIIFKCADALDYAHKQSVIHRDIKPSNILLTKEGDIRIADFSIAYMVGTDAAQTMPMGFVGSPRYMSPEQIQEDIITTQTDVFSLGIVMYELLTGSHPFNSKSFSRLIYKVVNEDPPPMRLHRVDVPDSLEQIVRRALEKAQEKRYKSASDLLADLSVAFYALKGSISKDSGQEKYTEISRLSCFVGYSDSDLWQIMQVSEWRKYAISEEVITDAGVSNTLYFIVSGMASVKREGHDAVVLTEGDCFGEGALVLELAESSAAVVDEETVVIALPVENMEKLPSAQQLQIYKSLLRCLIKRR